MSETIQLFVTCILDTLYPEVGEAVVHVLEKAGVKVDCPGGQTCCGQPAFNAGMRAEARRMAIHTIQRVRSRAWAGGGALRLVRGDDPPFLPGAVRR